VAIETLVSVVLLCFGIVLGNREELKPISWSVWSGLLEREKGCGQFSYLEERVGFLDIRVCPSLFYISSGVGAELRPIDDGLG